MAGLAWGALVLQWVMYIARALPIDQFLGEPAVDYACGSMRQGFTVPILCSRIWHADAVKTLGSLNRMMMVMESQRTYSIRRAQDKLLQGGRPSDFFHILKMDMKLLAWDSLFANLLETCAKLQFQTTWIALLQYTKKKAGTWKT